MSKTTFHTALGLFALVAMPAPLLSQAPPPNDDFANAQVITGAVGSVSAANEFATKQTGEPDHAGNPGGRSVWYRWIAPWSQTVVFDTAGSDFDTLLAVYTGTNVESLAELVSNDDTGDSVQSQVLFDAVSGTVYQVAVDGFDGASGTVVLNWKLASLPVPDRFEPNDSFEQATNLGTLETRVETNLSIHALGDVDFFQFTATTSSTVNVDLFFLNYQGDVDLFVYDADQVEIGSSTGTSDTEHVDFPATAGQTYFIQVLGFNSDNPDYDLIISGNAGAGIGNMLLPDLIVWADEGLGYLYGWSIDTNEIPGRILLRLTSATPNVGAGPMELRGGATHPDNTQDVYQRIYLDGAGFTNRLAGTFEYDPSHGHIHFDGYAQFNLRLVTGANGVGPIIAGGLKTSFCLLDSAPYNLSLPGAPFSGHYDSCDQIQGISVGWSDVYDQFLPNQWIDITDVPNGTYWLETIVDPDDHLLESNETNNTARIQITLDSQPASAYPPGDVNGDVHVSGGDSLLINQVLVGLRSNTHPVFAAAGFANGDLNQTNGVNGADSLLINQAVVGLRAYIVTKIVPASRTTNVPTPVTIYGIGFPTNSVSGAAIGSPVSLILSNVVVVSRAQINAVVPAGGGAGAGTVNVSAFPSNGVISFGRFINQ